MKGRLRIYRSALGDCCLLSLHQTGTRHYHVLLDCGAFLYGKAGDRRPLLDDLVQLTRGNIDVAIITHEACDQTSLCSDFPSQRLRFGKMLLPGGLAEKNNEAERINRSLRVEQLTNLLSVSGKSSTRPDVELESPGDIGTTLRAAARQLSREVIFYQPGDIEPLEMPGCQIRVLNPKQVPMAASAKPPFDIAVNSPPFDEKWQIPLPGASQMPFFREHYWGPETWRRLDGEAPDFWSGMAFSLRKSACRRAVPLTIELPGDQVMLFAPDVASLGQAGTFLPKTVFCKVSHHANPGGMASKLDQSLKAMSRLKLMLLPAWSALAYETFGNGPAMYVNQRIPRGLTGTVTVRPRFYELKV